MRLLTLAAMLVASTAQANTVRYLTLDDDQTPELDYVISDYGTFQRSVPNVHPSSFPWFDSVTGELVEFGPRDEDSDPGEITVNMPRNNFFAELTYFSALANDIEIQSVLTGYGFVYATPLPDRFTVDYRTAMQRVVPEPKVMTPLLLLCLCLGIKRGRKVSKA